MALSSRNILMTQVFNSQINWKSIGYFNTILIATNSVHYSHAYMHRKYAFKLKYQRREKQRVRYYLWISFCSHDFLPSRCLALPHTHSRCLLMLRRNSMCGNTKRIFLHLARFEHLCSAPVCATIRCDMWVCLPAFAPPWYHIDGIFLPFSFKHTRTHTHKHSASWQSPLFPFRTHCVVYTFALFHYHHHSQFCLICVCLFAFL